MEIGRTLSFITEDDEWVVKVLIGGLLLLSLIIPILGQLITLAVIGYMVQVGRNVYMGMEKPLPRWSDFGAILIRGLHYLAIVLVYAIPIFLLTFLFVCVAGGMGATMDDLSNETTSAFIGIMGCIFVPLMLLLGLATGAFSTAALGRYIAADQLSAAFEFGEVFALLRNHIGLWFLVLVVSLLSGFVAMLGAIACGVGIFFTMFVAYCMQGHAIGQVMRTITGSVPTSTPFVPPTPPTEIV
jgi:hypothetical protein